MSNTDKYRQKSQDRYKRRDYNNRSMSPFTRDNIKRGLNCPDDYRPDKRYCSKCMKDTHHPWLCQKFNTWKRDICKVCENGHHCETECLDNMNERIKKN